MYDPDDHQGPGFGSELERRQTPELARRRRKQGIYACLLGILMGVVMLGAGIYATRTGEMVRSFPGRLELTGPEASVVGALVLAGSAWLLWRVLRGPGRSSP